MSVCLRLAVLGIWEGARASERASGVNDTRFQKVDPDCDALTVRLNSYQVKDRDVHKNQSHSEYVQRFAKRWALGCETFLPGPAWLLLSKTGPTLYILE